MLVDVEVRSSSEVLQCFMVLSNIVFSSFKVMYKGMSSEYCECML